MMHSYMAVHRESGEAERVLILVLMEDALARTYVKGETKVVFVS